MLKIYYSNTQALVVDEESMTYFPMSVKDGQAVAHAMKSNSFWTEVMHKQIEFYASKGYRRMEYVTSKHNGKKTIYRNKAR